MVNVEIHVTDGEVLDRFKVQGNAQPPEAKNLPTDAAAQIQLAHNFGWPVPNFTYENDASLIRVAGSCIGGLLTAVATRPTIVYGSSDPQLPPCFVCGTAFSQHGSFPTCATHPYTADATCSAVVGAACVGAECRNGCVRTRSAPSAAELTGTVGVKTSLEGQQ